VLLVSVVKKPDALLEIIAKKPIPTARYIKFFIIFLFFSDLSLSNGYIK
jgi:hypothetical protein